jgi:hypothetical protein
MGAFVVILIVVAIWLICTIVLGIFVMKGTPSDDDKRRDLKMGAVSVGMIVGIAFAGSILGPLIASV